MSKLEIPRGYALVRISDLVTLSAQPAAEPHRQPGSAWEGLAIAVAMVTAALGHHDVDLGQLADGADPAAIIRALVPMAAAGLRNCLTEDSVGAFLRDLGEIAAYRGRDTDGRPL
jgi:hypothetical protein